MLVQSLDQRVCEVFCIDPGWEGGDDGGAIAAQWASGATCGRFSSPEESYRYEESNRYDKIHTQDYFFVLFKFTI